MNAKISVFLICVEAIIYLLSYNLRDCTFNLANLLLATSVTRERSVYAMTIIKAFLRNTITGNRLNLVLTPRTLQSTR